MSLGFLTDYDYIITKCSIQQDTVFDRRVLLVCESALKPSSCCSCGKGEVAWEDANYRWIPKVMVL